MNGFTRLGIAGLASLVLAAPLVGARPDSAGPPASKPGKPASTTPAPQPTPPQPSTRGANPQPGPPSTTPRGPKASNTPNPGKGSSKGKGSSQGKGRGSEFGQSKAGQARAAARARKEAIHAQVAGRKMAVKQDVCERHEDQIARIVPHLSRGATSVKLALDTMYQRVADFYASGQLTVENYDGMIVYVDAMKANADVSLATLNDFEFQVDCTNPGVGRQLMEYRTAVRAASESLQGYRTALVALISSMRASAAVTNSASQGDTDE